RNKLANAFGLAALPAGPLLAVGWWTTPRALPANPALYAHSLIDYRPVPATRGHPLIPHALVEACPQSYGFVGGEGCVVGERGAVKGAALESINFRHPFYDRAAPVYLGTYVTLDQGTGIVHSAPAYGIDDFISCRRYGMKDEEMLNPVQNDGRFGSDLPFFGG